jgi:hypothetical protein
LNAGSFTGRAWHLFLKATPEGVRMFEPLTQTVGQLALRWNCSARDVLTHAVQRNWPLYFYFDGLVIDVNDRANRFGGCQRQEDEADWLEKAIERAEETLARNALHARGELELSRFEPVLDQDASIALRATTEENKRVLKALRASIEAWAVARRRFHRNGAVRAAPATLQDIADRGVISFPIRAYHPDSPAWFIPDPDGPGELLEGRLVALEDMGPHPKQKLAVEDIFANMADIKVIEAAGVDDPPASPLGEQLPQIDLKPGRVEADAGAATAMPGTAPSTAMGRIAVEVAWGMECDADGVRPTAEEVMLRLRELATGQKYPETLRQAAHGKRGVCWITDNEEERSYGIDALKKTLSRWRKSRTSEASGGH